MLDGDILANTLICPQCESRSAKSNGELRRVTVLIDYQRLDEDRVRSLILYLRGLAEYGTNSHPKRALTAPSNEDLIAAGAPVLDPLWDHELDGESYDRMQLPTSFRRSYPW